MAINPFTGGSAALSAVPAEYQPQALQNLQQQRMAQLLMQQNQQLPQGQMVSGRFVAPSPFQNLATVANQALGMYAGYQADKGQLELAKAIREGQSAAMANYISDLKGKPPVEGGIYGPDNKLTMQTTADMYGPDMTLNPQYKQVAAVAGKAPDPLRANLNASMNDQLPSFMREYAMKEITKGPKWKEMTLVDPATGNKVAGIYDEGNPNPRSTWTPFGTSSEAISRSDLLTLRDRGIAVPQANMPNTNAPMVGAPTMNPPAMNAPVGNVPVVGGQVNVGQPAVKPATTASSKDLVSTYGYDPFKPPPMPPMPSGEAARDWQKNAYKPLEGTAGQKVDGAKMYYNSLEKYNNYVATLTPSDLANPSVRSRLDSLYATAKLTGKEANNLGVLNGGDERILEEVLPNYKNILVTQKNLKRIIDDQKEFASGVIVEAYGTQQKAVPENMRKFIVVPKTDVSKETTEKPKGAVQIQRAILNNEPIETRNGKWVYSKTGKAVE
jgi:hypothetical protein